MEPALALARGLHFAAVASLAGAAAFAVFVAAPPWLRRAFARFAWAGLVLALLSGLAWLALEAVAMSGRSPAQALSPGVLGVVLGQTRFGRVWLLRGALALVLAGALLAQPRRAGPTSSGLVLAASLALLASLAWVGHEGAEAGAEGAFRLGVDALHLVAAGLWLGALPPLALLLGRAPLDLARRATRRFSALGIIAVGTLFATGLVNSWYLVGGIPGLLGTGYGRILLLKLALFAAMLALASFNRQVLTPRLSGGRAPLTAVARLRRNASIEAALGFGVLLLVGLLGIQVPGAHSQPEWPLPFRLDPGALPQGAAAGICGSMVVLGLIALALAARRRRWVAAAAGMALVAGFGGPPLAAALVEAYPTTFHASPVSFSAASITRGAADYRDNCVSCHGAEGRGDGPAAVSLPIRPADLTQPHLFAHAPGDLYWWIGHGRGGVMPGFAAVLEPHARWDLINFVLARAAAHTRPIMPAVTSTPAPAAPDFDFTRGAQQRSLRQLLASGPVLLVLYRLPGSGPRLGELAAAEPLLSAAGLQLLAMPIDPAPGETEAAPPPPDFAALTGPEVALAYRLFEGPAGPTHCELLVDRAGFLRARWTAAGGLPDAAALMAQLQRLAQLPLDRPAAHHHHHD